MKTFKCKYRESLKPLKEIEAESSEEAYKAFLDEEGIEPDYVDVSDGGFFSIADSYEGHFKKNAGRDEPVNKMQSDYGFGLDDSKVSSNNQPTTNTEEDKGNGWVVFHLICGFVGLVLFVFGFLAAMDRSDQGFALAITGITGAIASFFMAFLLKTLIQIRNSILRSEKHLQGINSKKN